MVQALRTQGLLEILYMLLNQVKDPYFIMNLDHSNNTMKQMEVRMFLTGAKMGVVSN